MNERNAGNSLVDLKNNVAQHIDYIINVSIKTGVMKTSEEGLRRTELCSLPVENIYKISEQAEKMYEIHNDVVVLDRLLSELKEYGKEFVMKKYLGKREVTDNV